MNRVVITGMGIYSCLGKNIDEVREALFKGKSGIIYDASRKEMGFRSALTGYVEKPVLKGKLKRRDRIGLAEEGEYAYVATVDALEQAGIDMDFVQNNEVGILYGNDSTAQATIEAVDIVREKKDTTLLGSASIFQSMNSTVTMNLATIFKLRGINFTISGACASGSHAIGMAYILIKHGLQHQVICGGAQEINAYSMASFDALSAFSIRESSPTEASRPFDSKRDGLVPSGGAATVILESLESAKKRNAPILGEVIGYGFSSNGDHISVPNVEGPVRALQMCLKDAGVKANEIDYINAHATSTPAGDMNEAMSIDQVFGDAKPYITSTKSMTGHECWMAGSSEIVYSLIMMHNSFIAPNINLETPGKEAAGLNIPSQTVDANIDIFLSNSFGFGGTNASLIIKKYTGE
ncbi:beta-ketoacyl-[acyl-carrier-protein] synthase family protein [bacterium]|nr:beta-ketoacyl-[acyl-carrier-protein] synthase family protein [bacterium]